MSSTRYTSNSERKTGSENADPNEMIEGMLSYLGGVEAIVHAKNIIKPEFCEIHMDLPGISSGTVRDFFIDAAVVSKIEQIKASFGFSFF